MICSEWKGYAMTTKTCCGTTTETQTKSDSGYEIVRLEKTDKYCPLCDQYAEKHQAKQVVVLSCDGACLRGEVARQAANELCYSLAPEKTVRICLGAAFTKETSQRQLVRNAPRLIALEGCYINCASRMMGGVIEGLKPEVINVDQLYDFDRKLFGTDEMPDEEIKAHGRGAARQIAARL